jgi:hypothetical protein
MVVIRSFGAKSRSHYKMKIKNYISCKTIFYSLFILFILPFPAWSAIYYVDATTGNDTNNGISLSTSWKTIAKVNASRFNPGDQILFKRGEVWWEQLTVPSSGTRGYPIIFGGYGTGNNPVISGADIPSGWTEAIPISSTFTATDDGDDAYVIGTSIVDNAAVQMGNNGGSIDVGIRFRNVTLVEGATLSNAFITFPPYANGITTTCNVRFVGENTSAPSGFSSYADFTKRETNVTKANVNWDNVPLWTYGIDVNSPNLKSIIEEIVARPDWTPGGNLVVFIKNNSSSTNAFRAANANRETPRIRLTTTVLTAASNVWSAYCANEPSDVYFGSISGTRVATVGELTSANKWYWANSYLSVYSASDPGSTIAAYVRSYCIFSNGRDYITYQNLDLKNSKDTCLLHQNSTGVTIDGIRVGHNGSQSGNIFPLGINTDGVGSVLIQNCEADHVTWTGIAIYNNTANPVDNIVVQNNIAHDGGHNGLDFKYGDQTNVIFRYNKAYNNGSNGIYFQNGTGKSIASPQIYYNISYLNASAGISFQDVTPAIENAEIYNNTTYGNGRTLYGPGIDLQNATGCIIKNNIAFNNNVARVSTKEIKILDRGGPPNTLDYNLVYNSSWTEGIYDWNGNIWNHATAQSKSVNTHGISLNPQFASAGTDFGLQSTSPCVNAGTNVGLIQDYAGNPITSGANPDIGALSFGGKMSSPRNLRIQQ